MDGHRVDRHQMTEHLGEAVKFGTVSCPADFDPKENALRPYLERTFPRVPKGLNKETFGRYSLLYTRKGEQEVLDPPVMVYMDVNPWDR